jgi:hypothetical protein
VNTQHPYMEKMDKEIASESDPFSASLSLEQDTFDRSMSLLHELPSKDPTALNDYSADKDSSKSWKGSSPKVNPSPSVFPTWNKLTHLNRPLGTGTPNSSILENTPPVKQNAAAARRGSKSMAEDYEELMIL